MNKNIPDLTKRVLFSFSICSSPTLVLEFTVLRNFLWDLHLMLNAGFYMFLLWLRFL